MHTKPCRCKCFLWTTYWTTFMLVLLSLSFTLFFCFSFHKKRINSNKNEFNGEMRNDKLWQMELEIYQAICALLCCAIWVELELGEDWRVCGWRMKWLYLQCNKCSPWPLNMHNNPFSSFALIAKQLHEGNHYFLVVVRIETFPFFQQLFLHFEQIAHRTRNIFLIYFHFILFRLLFE